MLALLLAAALAGCSAAGQADETAAAGAATQAAPTEALTTAAAGAAAPVAAAATAIGIPPVTPALDPQPPTRLAIPEIGLDVPVEPMGWQMVAHEGVLTTAWVLPQDAAGWHVNGAGVGGAGNLIISGSQAAGAAVFAPLTFGDVQPGQEVLVTDSAGAVYTYRITSVAEPLPIVGATAEEEAQAAAFVAPTETPRLTLITGWPDFTSTHRVFAVADLVGAPD
jgi:hypothetical protein